jgi:DNA-binding NarL/FixJ family response regulator
VGCRTLIADDHDVVRRGLCSLLVAAGIEVVGEAANGREAVERSRELKPDVVVMDISMPELNGLEATRQIIAELPGTEVLILTMHQAEELVRQVLDSGARGYMLKSDAGKELVLAVQALRQHQPFLTTKISEMVLSGYLRKTSNSSPMPHSGGTARLTPREREILQLLAEGNSNKEIAAKLGISVKTAETHRSRVMAKLNLNSITDLVRYAVRNGIVEP